MAQFAPVGTEWHYNELTNYRSYSYHRCEKDTMIQGQIASKISHWRFEEKIEGDFVGNTFLTYTGDTALIFSVAENKFLHFFYPTKPGQKLIASGMPGSENFEIRVTDTSRIYFAGANRKVWVISTGSVGGIRFIEGIGYEDKLVPTWGFAFPTVYQFTLRCFNEEHFENYPNELACDSRWILSSETFGTKIQIISLFPNPASTSIALSMPRLNVGSEIQMFNAQGKLVFSKTSYLAEESIDVSGFKSGLYFVKISSDEGGVKSTSFVKE